MENQKKSKKKLIGIIIAVIAVIIVILAVTGSDEVSDDLLKFLNEDMQSVIDDREEVMELYEKWPELAEKEDIEGVYTLLADEILPKVDEILEQLEKVNPQTDEVKELKSLNVEGFTLLKEGGEKMIRSFNDFDEDGIDEGSDMVADGMEKINEYDKKLEELAKEHDIELYSK